VQGLYGHFHVDAVDKDATLDLRSGDDLDIHIFGAEGGADKGNEIRVSLVRFRLWASFYTTKYSTSA
jgi:hypothetical protein